MMAGTTPNWSRLKHAYGSASDLLRLFEGIGDPEAGDVAWEDLWASLCHQGTVYTASFAALPAPVDIATGRKPGACRQALGLAGRIVVQEQQLHEAGYVQARCPAAIRELHQLTLNIMEGLHFEGSADDFLHCLEHLLAWRCLLRVEHDVIYPVCAQCLEIDLFRLPAGTRRDVPGLTDTGALDHALRTRPVGRRADHLQPQLPTLLTEPQRYAAERGDLTSTELARILDRLKEKLLG